MKILNVFIYNNFYLSVPNDRKYILTYFLTDPNYNILTDYITQTYIFSTVWDSIYEI